MSKTTTARAATPREAAIHAAIVDMMDREAALKAAIENEKARMRAFMERNGYERLTLPGGGPDAPALFTLSTVVRTTVDTGRVREDWGSEYDTTATHTRFVVSTRARVTQDDTATAAG